MDNVPRDFPLTGVCTANGNRLQPCHREPLTSLEEQHHWQRIMAPSQPETDHFVVRHKAAAGTCHPGRKVKPTRLQTLFPAIPDLRLRLDQLALAVDVPSTLRDWGDSTVRLAYRNCW
jgi:hypothetical protein